MPIVQGGMAIRLSTARLAASVANEGGVGLIAASGLPFDELRKEIRLARKLSNGKGMIGINAMVAAREFKRADNDCSPGKSRLDCGWGWFFQRYVFCRQGI